MLKTIVCYNCNGIRHKWVTCVCGKFLCCSCARLLNSLCKDCLEKNIFYNYYNEDDQFFFKTPEVAKCH